MPLQNVRLRLSSMTWKKESSPTGHPLLQLEEEDKPETFLETLLLTLQLLVVAMTITSLHRASEQLERLVTSHHPTLTQGPMALSPSTQVKN